MGLISGSGRSHGEGNGNPLWYSCLENSMDRGAWQARVCKLEKSRTQLNTHIRRVSNLNHNHSTEVTWAWAGSRRWWRTRRPGELQSRGSQRVGHDWVTEQQQFKETEAQRYWATNLPKVFQLMETRFELWKYGSRILLFNHCLIMPHDKDQSHKIKEKLDSYGL